MRQARAQDADEARHSPLLDIPGHPHQRGGWPGRLHPHALGESAIPFNGSVGQNSSFTCTAIMRGLLSPPKPTPSKPVGGDVV
jgi:hypothetical protein